VENELYWQDVLLWSEGQAELLRRLAHGERVEGVDWHHVIEEVEDVGRTIVHLSRFAGEVAARQRGG